MPHCANVAAQCSKARVRGGRRSYTQGPRTVNDPHNLLRGGDMNRNDGADLHHYSPDFRRAANRSHGLLTSNPVEGLILLASTSHMDAAAAARE